MEEEKGRHRPPDSVCTSFRGSGGRSEAQKEGTIGAVEMRDKIAFLEKALVISPLTVTRALPAAARACCRRVSPRLQNALRRCAVASYGQSRRADDGFMVKQRKGPSLERPLFSRPGHNINIESPGSMVVRRQ